jgi:hypothetical protein
VSGGLQGEENRLSDFCFYWISVQAAHALKELAFPLGSGA